MVYMGFMPWLKALFRNESTSRMLRYRDNTVRRMIHLMANGQKREYSDFANSDLHLKQFEAGLFPDHFTTAFILSSDGAKITVKRDNHTYMGILEVADLPPEVSTGYSIFLNADLIEEV